MRGDRIRGPLSESRALEALRELHHVNVNFDVESGEELTTQNGWQIDNRCIVLPQEPPGPPTPGGPWETARQVLTNYEFADPSIVRAFYDPDDPLRGRTMLLEGRFYWMRFLLGVRVAEVTDEIRTVDGRSIRVWGWGYRTLQGHLEVGQMDYEIHKRLDSGDVEFHIHAFSKAAPISNPVVRLGFRLFGRHMQNKFARHALARMNQLVRSARSAPAAKQCELRPHHER